jgi:hypothetical protein
MEGGDRAARQKAVGAALSLGGMETAGRTEGEGLTAGAAGGRAGRSVRGFRAARVRAERQRKARKKKKGEDSEWIRRGRRRASGAIRPMRPDV